MTLFPSPHFAHEDDLFICMFFDNDREFYQNVRDFAQCAADRGVPMTVKRGRLHYENEEEGVALSVDIKASALVNQNRPNWVVDAFEHVVWMARVTKAASDPGLGLEKLHWNKNGSVRWQWKSRVFTIVRRRAGGIDLHVSDGTSKRMDSFDLAGALRSAYILKCAQKSERALTVQIGLKHFLETEHYTVKSCPPNMVIVDDCVAEVRVDGSFRYEIGRSSSVADAKRLHDMMAKFQASKSSATLTSTPESQVMTTTLQLV